jgi:hypothetical protein
MSVSFILILSFDLYVGISRDSSFEIYSQNFVYIPHFPNILHVLLILSSFITGFMEAYQLVMWCGLFLVHCLRSEAVHGLL